MRASSVRARKQSHAAAMSDSMAGDFGHFAGRASRFDAAVIISSYAGISLILYTAGRHGTHIEGRADS